MLGLEFVTMDVFMHQVAQLLTRTLLGLTSILRKSPFSLDHPINFHVELFHKKGVTAMRK